MSYVAGYEVGPKILGAYMVLVVMGDGSLHPAGCWRLTRRGANRAARKLAEARGVWVVD